MAMDRSAWCIARTSAPSSSVSPSDTSGPCADWAAKTAKSSTSCSRRADRVQEAATRRTEVSRYARTACCGPEPPRTAWSMRAKTSAVRSSAVYASRQQVRAYRRTPCAWRRYSSSYAVSSPARIRSMSSVSAGGRLGVAAGRCPRAGRAVPGPSRRRGARPAGRSRVRPGSALVRPARQRSCGKPPPAAQPVQTTGSDCHRGSWPGPPSSDDHSSVGIYRTPVLAITLSGKAHPSVRIRRSGSGPEDSPGPKSFSHPSAHGRERSPSSRMSSSRAEAAACCAASGSEGAAVAITSRTSDTDTSGRSSPAARARSTS